MLGILHLLGNLVEKIALSPTQSAIHLISSFDAREPEESTLFTEKHAKMFCVISSTKFSQFAKTLPESKVDVSHLALKMSPHYLQDIQTHFLLL